MPQCVMCMVCVVLNGGGDGVMIRDCKCQISNLLVLVVSVDSGIKRALSSFRQTTNRDFFLYSFRYSVTLRYFCE